MSLCLKEEDPNPNQTYMVLLSAALSSSLPHDFLATAAWALQPLLETHLLSTASVDYLSPNALSLQVLNGLSTLCKPLMCLMEPDPHNIKKAFVIPILWKRKCSPRRLSMLSKDMQLPQEAGSEPMSI